MGTQRDYYEILDIPRNASADHIARAYRKLAIQYHPDSHPGDQEATIRFKEAAEAYEVLSDPQKRARYDQFGHAGVSGQTAGFQDVEDIFEAFGDILGGGIFGDLFGSRRRRRVRRGADVQCQVTLTLEEAARGADKSVTFNRHTRCATCQGNGSRPGAQPQPCRRCGGAGEVVQSAGILRVQTTCPSCRGAGAVITDPCPQCRGSGVMAHQVEMTVHIPAGADHGMRLRLAGEGEPSLEGGPPGDCYCLIRLKPHRIFQRQGSDLVVEVPIAYSQAVLGAAVEIPSLDGRQTLDVPAGTQPGELFRLRGQGMPNPRNGQRGDLIVQLLLEVPKKISPHQEELLRKLAELERADVSPHRQSFLEKLREYFAPKD